MIRLPRSPHTSTIGSPGSPGKQTLETNCLGVPNSGALPHRQQTIAGSMTSKRNNVESGSPESSNLNPVPSRNTHLISIHNLQYHLMPASSPCATPMHGNESTTSAMASRNLDNGGRSLPPSTTWKRKRTGSTACPTVTHRERTSRACHRCKAKKLKCHFTADETRTYADAKINMGFLC